MALPYGRISIVISRNILLAYRKSSLPLLLLFTFWLKLGGDPVLHQFMNKVSIAHRIIKAYQMLAVVFAKVIQFY